jgi:hypothetical protein
VAKLGIVPLMFFAKTLVALGLTATNFARNATTLVYFFSSDVDAIYCAALGSIQCGSWNLRTSAWFLHFAPHVVEHDAPSPSDLMSFASSGGFPSSTSKQETVPGERYVHRKYLGNFHHC